LPDGNGISYENGEEVNITTNLTLYAIWEAKTYNVKYYYM
jgi:hypothetical protein